MHRIWRVSDVATPKSVNAHVDGSQSWRGQWAPRWWGLLPPPRTCPSPRPVTGGCHRHRSWSNRLTESVLLGPTFSPAAIPRSLLLLQFVTDFRSSVSSYFWPVLVENIVGIGVVVLPNSFLPRLWLWYVLRALLVYDFLIFGIFGFLSDTVRDLSFESCSRCDVVERRARVSVSIFLVSREVLFSLGVCVLVPHYADLFDSLFSSEYGIHHIFATKFGSSVTTSLLTWLTKAPYLVEVFFFSCSWYVLILYTWIIFSSRQTRCIIL